MFRLLDLARSKLARDSENASLIRSEDAPALARSALTM
jgi:hypothetical protein